MKTRSDYDKTKVNSAGLKGGRSSKPKPKIEYKDKKPEVEVDSDSFKDYDVPTPQGRKRVVISVFRNFLKTKTDDDLLKMLNNTAPMADAVKRHLAYEEAMARGIPEDKIDVRGSLQKLWDKYKRDEELKSYKDRPFNEDEAIALNYDWKGLDHEDIMHRVFEDGKDPAWLDANSPLVRKNFNLETLTGRQRYDTFKDYYQRDPNLVPGYLTAQQKVDELNGLLWDWAQNPDSPLFVSAGGAGAGKTYGWRDIVAEDLSLPELEPGGDPKSKDWGWVMLTDDDAEDDKTFAKTLEKYNGTGTEITIKGKVKKNGKEVKIKKPIQAMKNGIAYLPEDRKVDGIVGDLSVRDNIILALQVMRGFFKPFSHKQAQEFAEEYIKLLDIKTASADTPIKSLSGGNQQKVILGRWLLTHPEYLILDEPTRGIDVGTKVDIQKLVLKLASEGMSITFISSETDEMLRTCSRLVVMRDGKQVGELTGDELTQSGIMSAIAGGDK